MQESRYNSFTTRTQNGTQTQTQTIQDASRKTKVKPFAGHRHFLNGFRRESQEDPPELAGIGPYVVLNIIFHITIPLIVSSCLLLFYQIDKHRIVFYEYFCPVILLYLWPEHGRADGNPVETEKQILLIVGEQCAVLDFLAHGSKNAFARMILDDVLVDSFEDCFRIGEVQTQ